MSKLISSAATQVSALSENSQPSTKAPPFVDTPLKQAMRHAFDHPTYENIKHVADVALLHAEQQEPMRALALWLQRKVHDDAIYTCASAALFSGKSYEHNAGVDWPHEPDDDSYLLFENCQHPNCVLVRQAAPVASEGQK